MQKDQFISIIQSIISEAVKLRDAKTTEKSAPVNYACVFSQNDTEYESLLAASKKLGNVVQETAMGPVFQISPIDTIAGSLRLVKIRKPDSKRPERGDADFTVSDYSAFKKKFLGKPGFGIIKRSDMEMIELGDPAFNVLVYFSNPPLGKVLNLQ